MSLLQDPWIYTFCIGLIGLMIGSFLNVVILRWPARLEWQWRQEARSILGITGTDDPAPPDLVVSRSRCPKCQHQLSWWENIPVLSYLVLRGKCRSCKTGISLQYPSVELSHAFLWAAAAWLVPANPLALLFLSLMVVLTVIDLRTMLLPDPLVYLVLWTGILAQLLGLPGLPSMEQSLWGALVGYLSLYSVYLGFLLLTGKEGMGHGDFKLLAAIGVWCGVSSLLPIILMATVAGAVVGIALQIKRGESQPFAFGPFLAIAGVIQWILMQKNYAFLIQLPQ